jgi:outer membrane lipoprotein SlyB
MKTLFIACALALCAPFAANAAPMTNDDVIRLVRGGLGEATVIQAIDTSAPAFDTSPDGLIRLKQGGVSDTVIQRILAKGSAPAPAPAYAQPQQSCPNCGTVVSLRELEKPGQGGAGGAVAGGVVGGLLGNALGGSKHRTAGTVIGATGGALAGYEIQKHTSGTRYWEIGVRMDDGTTHAYTQDQAPRWKSGDRVRVLNGALSPL